MPDRIYPHDRFLARTVLLLVPPEITPNVITVFRMLLTPLVLALLYFRLYAWGTPLFLFTAFTDMMDGSLARTRHQITDWGRIYDPVADKMLIGGVTVLLLLRHFPLPLTILIVSFESIFLAFGWWRKRQGIIVSANWWGKLKMLCQVTGVLIYLLTLQFALPGLAWYSYAFFIVAVGFATLSLIRQGI